MKPFQGFPARMEFTAVPNVFFSGLLPAIDDIAELKTTLHVLALLYRKKGHPRLVTATELRGDAALMSSLGGDAAALQSALEMAGGRGTLLHVALEGEGKAEDAYLLNDEAGRQAAARLQSGELKLGGLKAREPAHVPAEAPPDIFTLYEQNIGMLTPMLADELREAEKLYPPAWIAEAIREAVAQNKRKWRYISAILEHWLAEGRGDGTYQRDSKKADPDRYVKGKYGHMVQR